MGDTGEAELRCRGAAKNDGAGFFQTLDLGIGMIINVAGENQRAMGGALALDPLGILDEQGNAFEGARLEAAFRVKLLCRFCLDEGFIEIAVGEAVYLFVQFPAARDLRFQQLNGRSLAGLEQLQKLRCRGIGQINIGHGQFPRIRVRQEFEP